ncbi:MAG: PilZ domain-containing protein [Marinobacter sp.]|uniref:PilZ domain-containing protein n=1 Tax=Marinobacter sp. TaxID=50741 RepID=UPI00299EFDCA|nr:PilZ domain-containing protein [Marinobacter sp.]MDX1754634.1 PilZ domain-containing protein [Marinobacter sp.]
MVSNAAERRIKPRYSARCLNVSVRERGFFGRQRKPTAVNCLDLNRYGMALISPKPIAPGSRLLLDMDGRYISESGVDARVVDCRPFQAGYRLGLRFNYCCDQQAYSRAMDNALSRIEGFYNRSTG